MSPDLRVRSKGPIGRRFLLEWAANGALGIALILWAALGHWRAGVDHLAYDRLLTLRSAPARQDIVVVEIDNASIAHLGRWPWPRGLHAQLLEQLAKSHPAAVVYDVLFTEPSAGDTELARAVGLTPTWLPVLLGPEQHGERSVLKPVASLAASAAGLGHINLEVDSDGIVRSVALFEGGEHSRWPQLTAPLWRAVRRGDITATELSAVQAKGEPRDAEGEGEARFLVPFSVNAEQYQKVSFASVVAGEAPPQMLRGKIVLVGATASGLFDRFATPVSGDLGPLPGVYIHANVLDALLSGNWIEPVSTPWLAAVSLVPFALLLAGFLVLSPRRLLLLTAALSVAIAAFSAALLYGARLWLSPVPAIAGLIAAYPLWNWRRLEMTLSYLRTELQRLADEPYLLPETPQPRREFGGDVLEQQMALMAQAGRRVQDMKRFVWDSLGSAPGPILVSDARGVVLIANRAAREHFARLGEAAPEGQSMRDALSGHAFVKAVDMPGQADAPIGRDACASADTAAELAAQGQWPGILDPTRCEFARLMARGIEVRDDAGCDHLLRYATCTNAQGQTTGWIASLVDISALHAAQRQRERALQLLSHDMRSPQASILALVEIERNKAEDGPTLDLLERIGRYAQRALTLADDFVQLARAESQTYTLEPVNLDDLLIEASDEIWPQMQAKHIRVETPSSSEAGHWINADRSLMTRALVNILSNAVKYSPPQTQITCTVEAVSGAPACVQCMIRDEGYGIPIEHQSSLFQRFRRLHERERPEVDGAGLGMAFVKTVVNRHGGHVQVDSTPGKGTTLTLLLPSLDDLQIESR